MIHNNYIITKIKNFTNLNESIISDSFVRKEIRAYYLMQSFNYENLKINPQDIIDDLEVVDIKSSYSKYQHFAYLSNSNGEEFEFISEKIFDQQLFLKQRFYIYIEIFKQETPITNLSNLFKQDIDLDELDSFLLKVNEVKSKVKNIFERMYSKKGDIECKVNFLTQDDVNNRTIILKYELTTLEIADNEYFKNLYHQLVNDDISKIIKETIKKLEDIYRRKGVNDPIIDVNEDDIYSNTETIMIGFSTDYEIFCVASIDKESGKVKIDNNEILRSLNP